MIRVLDTNKYIRENKLFGPVTSPQIYQGRTRNYHPQGLFSEDIFGIEGSRERRLSSSWIDLNCKVIHPLLYDILTKRIEKKIEALLSGEKTFSLDENGYLVEDENGDITGMSPLTLNIDKLRFRPGEDEDGDRNKIIAMLYDNIKRGTFFQDKLIVVSPEFRGVSVSEDGDEVTEDDLNKVYRKIITVTHQVKSVSGSLYDILCYKLQMMFKELYELIRIKVSKKQGIIRKLMLGKRTDFSARAVISPNPKLTLGEIGVPLRIICQIFEPHLVYGLVNSKESDRIPQEFHDEVRKFLRKETDEDLLIG